MGVPCVLAFMGFKKEPEKKPMPEDDVILLIKRAKLAESKGEADEADELYHKALSAVTQHQEKGDMSDKEILSARIHIYDNMANLCLSRGQFKEAENLFKETMRGQIQKGVPETDNSIVEMSMKLSMVYAMQDKKFEAEQGYLFCINTQKEKLKTLKEEDVDIDTVGLLGMCANSYARFLMVNDRLSEAEEQMNQCIEISLQVFGPSHPQVAVLLNDLATVESLQKKHAEAAKTLDQAILVAQNSASPDLSQLHCNQGNVYLNKQDYKTAKRCCEIALRLAQDAGDKHAIKQAKACVKQAKELLSLKA